MTNNNPIQKLAWQIADSDAQHLEEFASAYYKKVKIDPRKCVMIAHHDFAAGKVYYWFEKKRGRTRKDILNNAKKHDKQ